MSTIFISHSSQDNAIAKELERRLAEQNHPSVFLDLDPEKGIVAGQSWEQTLYRKLRACRGVIALCTDNYLRSQWCFAEIALARMEGKHIIALQADPLGEGAKLPAILTERQFIDLRTKGEEGYRRLWKGLKEQDLLGVTGEWDPKKPPYLGLSAYHEAHAPVFFGREDESRAGLELLARGAPGLIMVLGASGSGKSSLVRAGMLPRLRREEGQWLVVDPFRPGRDSYRELAESIVQTWRRYAPEHAARVGSAEQIRVRLEAWAPPFSTPAASAAPQPESAEAAPAPGADQRVARLIQHIEELRNDPPALLQERLRHFLDWSLDDLQRISGEAVPSAAAMAAGGADTTPLVDLARDLQRASGQRNARVLLIVDQFEELLGREEADDKANRFLGLLRASLEAEHSPLMALGTMRSDFLGVFQRNAALRGIDFESLSLGPMRVDGMRRVIEEPAKLGAIELETGLADRLIKDTETPDALPLLSFTLSVLWRDCRQDGKLDIREYDQLGGLNGAIAGEADALLASAKNEGKEEPLRRAFLRMARLTEEGGYARQPVAWDSEELRPVHSILERFVDRRLLVSRAEGGERMVEVAHEALFRSWTPLKTWLDNNRAELLLRQQVQRDAKAWQESDRAPENLWRGGRLLQARELVRKGQLAELEREFVRMGLQKRTAGRMTVAGIILAVIAGLGWLYWDAEQAKTEAVAAYGVAEQEKTKAVAAKDHSQRTLSLMHAGLSRQQTKEGFATVGVLLALEALPRSIDKPERPYVPEAEGALYAALDALPEGRILQGPKDQVRSAVFSPDGTRVVTASSDKTARLWDVASGKLVAALKGHKGAVYSAVFSPDGTRVVTASSDKTARLWDVASGTQVAALKGHEGAVYSAVFSPDGTRVVTISEHETAHRTARLWDVASGTQVPGFNGRGVYRAAFSPDSTRVVTAASNRARIPRVWDVASGTQVAEFKGHEHEVSSIAFSPDGTQVVTASGDGTARVWDVASGTQVAEFGHEARVQSAVFSADGTRVVTASSDKTARLWDLARGTQVAKLEGHEGEVISASFSADGTRVVTASRDNTARVWDLARGTQVVELKGHEGEVIIALFSSDGSQVVTASRDKTARLWDLARGTQVAKLEGHEGEVISAVFGPDGARVVTASEDNTARVWDVASGTQVAEFKGHEGLVTSAVFRPDGTRVVTASRDSTARLWDVASGTQVAEFKGHWGLVTSAVFSPDGTRVVTAATDYTARVWDVASGKLVATFKGEESLVNVAAFSRDGTQVVTASENEVGSDSSEKTARLWDVESDKLLAVLTGHEGLVISAVFSPDGTRVVTASSDNTARVWDVASGTQVAALDGHVGAINSVAFSPGGTRTRVVTASKDNTARVWDILSTQQLIDRALARVPRKDKELTKTEKEKFFVTSE